MFLAFLVLLQYSVAQQAENRNFSFKIFIFSASWTLLPGMAESLPIQNYASGNMQEL